MRIKQTVLTILLVVLSVLPALAASQTSKIKAMGSGSEVYLVRKADNFIVLYDRSGSMGDILKGTVMTELAAQRKILIEKNATLPDMDWQAGIYSFTPANSFDNLVTYYPMQQYDKKRFSRTLSRMPREPKGATLLQQGLTKLEQVLARLSGKTVIFLFSDGQYTPIESMKSPGELARGLASRHDLCFAVINTGAEKQGFKSIKAIAAANECSYMVSIDELLGNPEWMTNSLFSVVEKKPEDTADFSLGYEWQNILFDFDKSDIKAEYHDVLAKVGAFMKEYPKARVVLAGHTDSVGTREYNMKLSHRRAASVRRYLVEKEGIDENRITLSGFGFEDPVATNDTAEGRALNRRVQGIFSNIE